MLPTTWKIQSLEAERFRLAESFTLSADDFMEEPPKKYFRMFPGNEVRLMNAYFVKCTGCVKDENGNVIVGTWNLRSEHQRAETASDGRKVKGTIHWVAATRLQSTLRFVCMRTLVDEEKGKLNEDGTLNFNPNSLNRIKGLLCWSRALKDAKAYDSFQFVRNGFFCVDCKDSEEGKPVFNRIVSLKSSFKLPK